MSVSRRRVLLVFVALLFALLVAAVAAAPLVIDAYATSRARTELGARGITCDERFAIDVATFLGSATVAPTRCTIAEGSVDAFELLDPVAVELDGVRPSHIRAGRLRVSLREDPPASTSDGWGGMLSILQLPSRAALIVVSAAQLASRRVPKADVTSIELVREGRTILTVAELSADGGAPLHVHAARVELPSLTAGGLVDTRAQITPLDITATPAHVELEGTVVATALGSLLGGASPTLHLALTADGLDGPSPAFRLRAPR